ncbi:MAG: AMIN-like domain-containing (lipo)protein [Acidimicrobiia bacterium]
MTEPLHDGEAAVTSSGDDHRNHTQEVTMKRLLATMIIGVLAASACAEAGPERDAHEATVAYEKALASQAATIGTQAPQEAAQAQPAESQEGDTLVLSSPAGEGEPPGVDQANPVQDPGGGVEAEPAVQCPSASGGGDYVANLVDVRVGTHEGFDRVVFELAPSAEGPQYFGIPRYEIGPATPPIIEDPSGEPVAVDGSSFAWIGFHGASGVEFTNEDPGYYLTYTGPRELKPGFEVLAEAQQTGDFERTLFWAFGLTRASCWQVLELDDPLRLVIDFPHS